MDNYFNYFTEIEEYFWKQRGTSLLLSALDWALIDSWKEAQIPLETVLKGIARSFEKHESRRRKIRMVNSLAYCQQEVLAAFQEQQKSNPAHSAPEPFAHDEVTAFLLTNSSTLEKFAVRLDTERRPESAATFRALAASLTELMAKSDPDRGFDLEEMERRLTVLEDKMISTLLTVTPEDDLVAIRAELDRQLAPVRQKMSAEQIALLQKQFLTRKLLEKASLPRLSLFYL
jgi:hypothetical protein